MDTITVNLPNHNRSWTWNRKLFTTLFPDSIITIATTEADTVDITSPDVTPQALDLLDNFLTGPADIIEVSPDDVLSLTTTDRYLNLALFRILVDPNYPDLTKVIDPITLTRPAMMNRLYPHIILPFGSDHQFATLFAYVWTFVPATYPEEDGLALAQQVIYGDLNLVRQLMTRTDPSTAAPYYTNRDQIHTWMEEIDSKREESFNDGVTSVPIDETNNVLLYAIAMENSPMIQLLATDPRVKDDGGYFLTTFVPPIPIAQTLISTFTYTPEQIVSYLSYTTNNRLRDENISFYRWLREHRSDFDDITRVVAQYPGITDAVKHYAQLAVQ